MLRVSSVRTMVLEIASLRQLDDDDDPGEMLRKARRRAALVAALDWLAILVLFLWRDSGRFLQLGGTEQGLFTLGVLAVATHAGFRLGQREKYAAVAGALEELPPTTDPGLGGETAS